MLQVLRWIVIVILRVCDTRRVHGCAITDSVKDALPHSTDCVGVAATIHVEAGQGSDAAVLIFTACPWVT